MFYACASTLLIGAMAVYLLRQPATANTSPVVKYTMMAVIACVVLNGVSKCVKKPVGGDASSQYPVFEYPVPLSQLTQGREGFSSSLAGQSPACQPMADLALPDMDTIPSDQIIGMIYPPRCGPLHANFQLPDQKDPKACSNPYAVIYKNKVVFNQLPIQH